MTAKEIERAAYAAAHRILDANTTAPPELACPGARRSHAVDGIADIIREEFELRDLNSEDRASLPARKVESGLRVVCHRRVGVLLELPCQAVPDEVA